MPAISNLIRQITLPKERPNFDPSLYLVANRPSFRDEEVFFNKIQEAVKGGVSCVQLRDYRNNSRTLINLATHLKDILGKVPLFINSRESIEVANAVGAEGVFLEGRVSYDQVRKCLGEKAIIGVPVKTMGDLIITSRTDAIDYISVRVFPSKQTCPSNTDFYWGLKGLEMVRSMSPHKIVAVGGLNQHCVESVYKALRSGDGAAMAGGLMRQQDPCRTAQMIQNIRKNL